jgi:hypothetical protein
MKASLERRGRVLVWQWMCQTFDAIRPAVGAALWKRAPVE